MNDDPVTLNEMLKAEKAAEQHDAVRDGIAAVVAELEDADDEVSAEERARRRGSLARARAGVSPLVRAEDVTLEDEPDETVRVPLRQRMYQMPTGAPGSFVSAVPNVEASRADHAQRSASERWQGETATEPLEHTPAPPSPEHAAALAVARDAFKEGRRAEARTVLEEAGIAPQRHLFVWMAEARAERRETFLVKELEAEAASCGMSQEAIDKLVGAS